jgi:hypothetical protein
MNLQNSKVEHCYDIEITKNLFLIVFSPIDKDIFFPFQISPFRDDRKELVLFLNNNVSILTGFNNLTYDNSILQRFITLVGNDWNIKGREIIKQLYDLSQFIVAQQKPKIIAKPIYPQRDLMKIHHFDNKAKITSLKGIEFVLRMRNIEEMPFHFSDELSQDTIENVAIPYCINDVTATKIFRLHKTTVSMVEMREHLSPIYDIDFTNFNDVKIGESIFMKKIIDKGGRHLLYDESGRVRNTDREEIRINEIILPFVNFTHPEFRSLLEFYRGKVLYKNDPWIEQLKDKNEKMNEDSILNGIFSKLKIEEVSNIPYIVPEIKKKRIGTDNGSDEIQYQKSLNINYYDKIYYFGSGGIHMSCIPGVYLVDDDWEILDFDVEGYYPSESIEYKFEPEHLKGYYSDTHLEIKKERKKYPKKTPANTGLKLAGNGTYGKGNSKFSSLRDAQYVAATCINGQLLLAMLIERITVEIGPLNVDFLQANTDGFTVKSRRQFHEQIISIVKRWEKLTNLVMEMNEYKEMVIKDVNNYIAVFLDGHLKNKGTFIWQDLELHKDYSQLIVPKAVEYYFTQGISIEQTIRGEKDPFMFFKKVKIQKIHRLVTRTNYSEVVTMDYSKSKKGKRIISYTWDNEYPQQHLSRYFVSIKGQKMFKIMPPLPKEPDKQRETNIEAGWDVTVWNYLPDDFESLLFKNVNYDYYINEANKIIRIVEQHIQEENDEQTTDSE